jgi:hypothetical protein
MLPFALDETVQAVRQHRDFARIRSAQALRAAAFDLGEIARNAPERGKAPAQQDLLQHEQGQAQRGQPAEQRAPVGGQARLV